MVAKPNPIIVVQGAVGDEIEIEVVRGGFHIYNYNADKDDTFLTILSKATSRELLEFLTEALS